MSVLNKTANLIKFPKDEIFNLRIGLEVRDWRSEIGGRSEVRDWREIRGQILIGFF